MPLHASTHAGTGMLVSWKLGLTFGLMASTKLAMWLWSEPFAATPLTNESLPLTLGPSASDDIAGHGLLPCQGLTAG